MLSPQGNYQGGGGMRSLLERNDELKVNPVIFRLVKFGEGKAVHTFTKTIRVYILANLPFDFKVK